MATMSQITLPVFVKHLNALAACMKKAQAPRALMVRISIDVLALSGIIMPTPMNAAR